MAKYIKANPKVARYLRVENDRNQVADGNYLLWQADMLAFGRLTELPSILEQIGGLALQAHEAREEQDGTVLRKLPTATDPRFVEDIKDVEEDTEAGSGADVQAPGDEPEPDSGETSTDTGTGTGAVEDEQEQGTTETGEAQEAPDTEGEEEKPVTDDEAQETTGTDDSTDENQTETTINEETEA
mgnify:CR=1 FL=1